MNMKNVYTLTFLWEKKEENLAAEETERFFFSFLTLAGRVAVPELTTGSLTSAGFLSFSEKEYERLRLPRFPIT